MAEDITGTTARFPVYGCGRKTPLPVSTVSYLPGAGPNGCNDLSKLPPVTWNGTGVLTAVEKTISLFPMAPCFTLPIQEAEIHLTSSELNFDSNILVDVAGNNTNNWGIPGPMAVI